MIEGMFESRPLRLIVWSFIAGVTGTVAVAWLGSARSDLTVESVGISPPGAADLDSTVEMMIRAANWAVRDTCQVAVATNMLSEQPLTDHEWIRRADDPHARQLHQFAIGCSLYEVLSPESIYNGVLYPRSIFADVLPPDPAGTPARFRFLDAGMGDRTEENPYFIVTRDAGWPFSALSGRIELLSDDSVPLIRSAGILSLHGRWSWKSSVVLLPYRPHWIGFLLNTGLYGVGFWLLFSGLGAVHRRVRIRIGKCPKCGYDLRGDHAAGCPECGWGRSGRASDASAV